MKPILFVDFDGTLCFDRYWRSLPADKYAQVQQLIFGQGQVRGNDWMIGKYSAEDINRYLAEELDIPYETLWELFVRDCTTMEVSKEVLETIGMLREKYITILITGNMDSFSRFTVPALALDSYFDHVDNSYFSGKQKSDNNGAAFLEHAHERNVPIDTCILIDDSVKICEIFRSFGGTTYQITPEQSIRDYLALLT